MPEWYMAQLIVHSDMGAYISKETFLCIHTHTDGYRSARGKVVSGPKEIVRIFNASENAFLAGNWLPTWFIC